MSMSAVLAGAAADIADTKANLDRLVREQELAIYDLLRATASLGLQRMVIARKEAELQAFLAQSAAREISTAPSAAAPETNPSTTPPAAPAGEPEKGQ